MPIVNGIGQSMATHDKQAGLSLYLNLHMRIVQNIFSKWRWDKKYHYIDVTAGDGINQEIGISGSPIIFLQQAKKIGINYRAWFIELEEGSAESLRGKINDSFSSVITGNHDEIVPEILSTFTGKEYGLLYMDKNGIPNFELLQHVSETHKKIDILVRCPAGAIKRNRHANIPTLIESISKIKKEYKMIRSPLSSDGWQWIFLYFANYAHGDWKKQRFYSLRSNDGKEILREMNLTNDEIEILDQPMLFIEDIIKQRSGGICEICRENPATEIHHVKGTYGEFDPDCRIHICHSCHCILEGVAS